MHNGQIANFERIRRPMEGMLSDELFSIRTGTTDSELIFLLALQLGLDHDPVGAMERTVAVVEDLSREKTGAALIRFTTCFSNGRQLFAVRYATDHKPPTLYAAPMGGSAGSGYCLVSEPLNDDVDAWTEIPDATVVQVCPGGMKTSAFRPRLLADAA
jgi:glutamine amidotransferase